VTSPGGALLAGGDGWSTELLEGYSGGGAAAADVVGYFLATVGGSAAAATGGQGTGPRRHRQCTAAVDCYYLRH